MRNESAILRVAVVDNVPDERRSPSSHSGIRLLIVVTTGQTASLLMKGQLRFLASQGFDITVVGSPDEHLRDVAKREGVKIVALPISRSIGPVRDLWTLWRLWQVIRAIQPQIVNASTPKAGLLGMIAAFVARVPVRIYTLRGLRFETSRGVVRWAQIACEQIASACAHRVVCVSRSLADKYSRIAFIARKKVMVLGAGSSNGVNAARFAPTPARIAHAQRLRKALGIQPGDLVIGYVGRLARDKGVADLVRAFMRVGARFPSVRLVIVGDFDKANAPDQHASTLIRTHPRISMIGFVDDVVPYYHAMNVLAFPSYREGFPNAVLEAQAARLPVVGYRATGVVDAILDGVTGRLVPIGAVDEMAAALIEYLRDPKLAAVHGARGQQRIQEEFCNQRIWSALLSQYTELLQAAGLASPTGAVRSRGEVSAA